jgi:hypothetical protein
VYRDEIHVVEGDNSAFIPSSSTLKFSGENASSAQLTNLKTSTFYIVKLRVIDAQGLQTVSSGIGVTTQNSLGLSKLNDTGITFCVSDSFVFTIHDSCLTPVKGWFANQDGEIGRDALAVKGTLTKLGNGDAGFDFTKISVAGLKLNANATQWSCVLDNHTGLMWEVKTDDGGVHDKDNLYTWYNPDNSVNGGFVGYTNNEKNTFTFVQNVNSQGLCGYADWRLATVAELQGIISYHHYNEPQTAIDLNYFPNFLGSMTQSPYVFKDYIWAVGNDGGVVDILKNANSPVLLVRSNIVTN